MTMEPQSPRPAGIDRRRLLKKAAVGGAVAWTAPVVLSNPAFAQCTSAGATLTTGNSTVGAALTWNITATYRSRQGQRPDRVELAVSIDGACTGCTNPILSGTPAGSTSFEVLEPAGIGFSTSNNPSGTLPVTFSTTGSLPSGLYVAGSTDPYHIPRDTWITVAFTIQFRCTTNGPRFCSKRAVRFRVPTDTPDSTVLAAPNFEYPRNYSYLGTQYTTAKGFAVNCCVGGSNPLWC